MGGSVNKAQAAADHLKRINPSAEILYADMSIPMPGHPIADIEKEEVNMESCCSLSVLISFLSMIHIC